MTRFVSGATTVQFNRNPSRPGGRSIKKRQIRERDSSGGIYVYNKSTRKEGRFRLRFAGYSAIDDATLAALESFLRNTVRGIRDSFTWYDQDEVARSVKFAAPAIHSRPVGPDRNEVEIILEEVS